MAFGPYQVALDIRPSEEEEELADIIGKDILVTFDNVAAFFTADKIPAPTIKGCEFIVAYVNVEIER